MAAARCVLPQPDGPLNTSQPDGSSANWRGGGGAKGRRGAPPGLRERCGRASRSSSRSSSVQRQGNALPKSGWPSRTVRRTKPAPPQSGEGASGGPAAGGGGGARGGVVSGGGACRAGSGFPASLLQDLVQLLHSSGPPLPSA